MQFKFDGCVLAPNGKVYGVPYDARIVGEFDPATKRFTPIDISSTISSHEKYLGGVLAPSGNIYFGSNSGNNVGEFDPSTKSFTTITSSSGTHWGGVLAPNGKIYFCNVHQSRDIGEFDPSTKTYRSISSTGTTGNLPFIGGVLAQGKLFCIPYDDTSIGEVTPGSQEPAYEVVGGTSEAWSALLSPHFNKY